MIRKSMNRGVSRGIVSMKLRNGSGEKAPSLNLIVVAIPCGKKATK